MTTEERIEAIKALTALLNVSMMPVQVHELIMDRLENLIKGL